jgi:hypothetical protein
VEFGFRVKFSTRIIAFTEFMVIVAEKKSRFCKDLSKGWMIHLFDIDQDYQTTATVLKGVTFWPLQNICCPLKVATTG